MSELPFLTRARAHASRTAFAEGGAACTYAELVERSGHVASALLAGSQDLDGARVGLLVGPGVSHAAAQWGVWRAGGVKVPLCLSATESEWEYSLTDSGVATVLADEGLAAKVGPLCARLGVRLLSVTEALSTPLSALPKVSEERDAMILYTSGTTSRPKGVVTTHANLAAQMSSLVEAWEWSSEDRIPMFLPLHHVHGVVNVTGCALWSGALIEPFQRFDAAAVLNRVRAGAYTVFMAVPTVYVKLIEALEAADEDGRRTACDSFRRMRLMVSGSAALPTTVFARWEELTGQRLLERYGMTEIGMALSNPLRGERRPGSVGTPLPGVTVRLKAENGPVITDEGEPGEIQVRGPAVFRGYWGREEATRETFEDGWFRTGDMAVRETGYYRIMGRLSVDIIKSGGYKLSALEIEAVLLEHPSVAECAVIGLPDDTWGEAVTAVCVTRGGAALELKALREWCKGRMSVYKVPQRLLTVKELPRNAMGKVTKPAVRKLFG